ncbi:MULTISPECIES: YcgJ family protein [Aphanothece]|uniref:YcgJ family protein n=1 Tax=Aphanothece TaxID=1121 RepID=UPI003984CE37
MKARPHNVCLTALAGAAAVTAGLLATHAPVEARPDPVSMPGSGVICDQASQTCYDRDGVSLPHTRTYFGPQAERRLWSGLIGRPPSREFSLSNGTVCDVREETCWSDGNGRRRLDREMTRELFGKVTRPDREITTYSGRCTLARGANLMHDGTCSLRLVERRDGVTRYVVNLPDERRFVFSDRSDRLQVTDATGSWPVTYIDHGYTGVFRWRDMTLVATRANSGLGRSRNASEGIGELFKDR